MGKTLFDKIWEAHVIKEIENGPSLLYIDRHLIHEVTSPQAFLAIKEKGLRVRRPDMTFATCDHNTPTLHQELPIEEPSSAKAVAQLAANTKEFGIKYFPLGDPGNGIVHVCGPERGVVLCGQTVVCGDSHTATHGAFGNIAFGIGTSEVAMVFASQSLLQNKPGQTKIEVNGRLAPGVCAKDVILYIISKLGTSGCNGTFVEYCGSTFRAMSMEERMTVCNMSIEMGARGGLIAPDQTTFNYIKGRPYAPAGEAFDKAVEEWKRLKSDEDAHYDYTFSFKASDIEPMVTYGTNPGMGCPVTATIPESAVGCDAANFSKALNYMSFAPGEPMLGKKIDYIFLGSCTNGRIEDFRAFASVVKGHKKAEGITAWLVPGSKEVERKIEEEGLGEIIREAGFEIRQPGCSACLAMNADKVPAGKYCLSTSNRNFEGRQGTGARTILAGPLAVAAAGIRGVITDPREFVKSAVAGSKEKFISLTSTAVVIPVNNIDTDQIIPARFLKTTSRDSFAGKLFNDLRYKADGEPNPDFELNRMQGKILVAGRNFGCGSSREHAAWALYDYGFRAVVSSSFADIFRNNALNNGLVPVTVSQEYLDALTAAIGKDKETKITVSLEECTISYKDGCGTLHSASFEIGPYKRECLMKGYDDIDYLVAGMDDILDFEEKRK